MTDEEITALVNNWYQDYLKAEAANEVIEDFAGCDIYDEEFPESYEENSWYLDHDFAHTLERILPNYKFILDRETWLLIQKF